MFKVKTYLIQYHFRVGGALNLTEVERGIVSIMLQKCSDVDIAELQYKLRISRSVIGRLLYNLERKGVIERFKVKGETHARLKGTAINMLRSMFKVKTPIAYLGLVGFVKDEYPEIITITSLKKLRELGVKVSKAIVASSNECISMSRSVIEGYTRSLNIKTEYAYLKPDDYQDCIGVLRGIVESNIRTYNIVCDVTGGTKIMTLALSHVALEYKLPILYVYIKNLKPIMLNVNAWRNILDVDLNI